MFTQITYRTNLIKQILCSQVTRVYTWEDPKITELLKKIYLKYLYKFETLVPFEVLPPATGCSNPSTAPNAGNIV